MTWVISILKLALPFITAAQTALSNLDENSEGWDDQLAQKLKEITGTFITIIGSVPAGAARGYAEIVQFGNNVIAALDRLIANTELPHAEKLAEAQVLVASLSDSSKVYQAKKGSDAAALTAFKDVAESKLGIIIAQAPVPKEPDTEETSETKD